MSLNRKLFSKSASDAVCNSESLEPFGNEASFNKNVAVYQFEDNLNDSSGNGNNGTDATSSTVTYNASGKFGKAASFDGTNDRFTVPAGLGTSGDRSRSFWIKINAMPASSNGDNIYYIGSTSANEYYETVAVQETAGASTYKIRWQERHDTSTTSSKDSTSTLTTGVWYHIVVVQEGTSRKIYINGVLDSTHTNSNSVNNTSYPAVIGSFREGANCCYYDGLLDQFRFYNDKALSQEEVTTLYVDETTSTASSTTIIPGTSCVAYYPLDYDASDKSTNYDGTPSNVEFVQNGKINYSALFNGSNSAITSSGAGTALNVASFSASLWFKATSVPTTGYGMLLSSYDESGNARFYFALHDSGLEIVIYGSSVTWVQEYASTVSANTWYHLVVTHTGTTTTTYLNGSSISSSGTSGSATAIRIASSPQALTFGQLQGYSGTYPYSGLMDEVRIFNKALSASEVSTLAGLTACSPTCTTDNQDFIATNTAYYKLDGDATDYHSGTYDATATNITYASGRFGSSAEFNGSSSILDTTVSVPTNWTLSLWLKRDPSGYFGGTTNASVQSGVYFYSNPNGSIAVYNRDGSGGNIDTFYSSAGLVNQNQWHHIAMSFDSTSGTGLTTIYLDGSEIGSVDGTPSHSTAFKFGRSGDYASDYFDGYIDQIRIFSSALTDTNIQDLYDTEFQCYITKDASQPFTSGEVAFFKFENNLTDSTGSYAADASSVAYTTTDPAFGTYSLSFNDTSNYIDFGTSGKIPVVGVSYWVKMNAAGSATRDAIIHSEETSSTYFGCVRWGTSDSATGFYAGGSYWNYSGSDWQLTGKWHHIYQDKDLNVYLNGVQINSGSVGATSQNIRYVGKYPTGSSDYYMNGYMAQLRVFSTTLTGAQVWKLYAERNN